MDSCGINVRKLTSRELLRYDQLRREQQGSWDDIDWEEVTLESGSGSPDCETEIKIVNSYPAWKEMYEAQRRDSKDFCDLHFIAQDGYIPVHRVFLQNKSKYLDTLITESLRVATPSENNVISITLMDSKLVHLKAVLTLLYCGSVYVDKQEVDDVKEVLRMLQLHKEVKLDMSPAEASSKKKPPKLLSSFYQINSAGEVQASGGNSTGPSTSTNTSASASSSSYATASSSSMDRVLSQPLEPVQKVAPGTLVPRKPADRIQRGRPPSVSAASSSAGSLRVEEQSGVDVVPATQGPSSTDGPVTTVDKVAPGTLFQRKQQPRITRQVESPSKASKLRKEKYETDNDFILSDGPDEEEEDDEDMVQVIPEDEVDCRITRRTRTRIISEGSDSPSTAGSTLNNRYPKRQRPTEGTYVKLHNGDPEEIEKKKADDEANQASTSKKREKAPPVRMFRKTDSSGSLSSAIESVGVETSANVNDDTPTAAPVTEPTPPKQVNRCFSCADVYEEEEHLVAHLAKECGRKYIKFYDLPTRHCKGCSSNFPQHDPSEFMDHVTTCCQIAQRTKKSSLRQSSRHTEMMACPSTVEVATTASASNPDPPHEAMEEANVTSALEDNSLDVIRLGQLRVRLDKLHDDEISQIMNKLQRRETVRINRPLLSPANSYVYKPRVSLVADGKTKVNSKGVAADLKSTSASSAKEPDPVENNAPPPSVSSITITPHPESKPQPSRSGSSKRGPLFVKRKSADNSVSTASDEDSSKRRKKDEQSPKVPSTSVEPAAATTARPSDTAAIAADPDTSSSKVVKTTAAKLRESIRLNQERNKALLQKESDPSRESEPETHNSTAAIVSNSTESSSANDANNRDSTTDSQKTCTGSSDFAPTAVAKILADDSGSRPAILQQRLLLPPVPEGAQTELPPAAASTPSASSSHTVLVNAIANPPKSTETALQSNFTSCSNEQSPSNSIQGITNLGQNQGTPRQTIIIPNQPSAPSSTVINRPTPPAPNVIQTNPALAQMLSLNVPTTGQSISTSLTLTRPLSPHVSLPTTPPQQQRTPTPPQPSTHLSNLSMALVPAQRLPILQQTPPRPNNNMQVTQYTTPIQTVQQHPPQHIQQIYYGTSQQRMPGISSPPNVPPTSHFVVRRISTEETYSSNAPPVRHVYPLPNQYLPAPGQQQQHPTTPNLQNQQRPHLQIQQQPQVTPVVNPQVVVPASNGSIGYQYPNHQPPRPPSSGNQPQVLAQIPQPQQLTMNMPPPYNQQAQSPIPVRTYGMITRPLIFYNSGGYPQQIPVQMAQQTVRHPQLSPSNPNQLAITPAAGAAVSNSGSVGSSAVVQSSTQQIQSYHQYPNQVHPGHNPNGQIVYNQPGPSYPNSQRNVIATTTVSLPVGGQMNPLAPNRFLLQQTPAQVAPAPMLAIEGGQQNQQQPTTSSGSNLSQGPSALASRSVIAAASKGESKPVLFVGPGGKEYSEMKLVTDTNVTCSQCLLNFQSKTALTEHQESGLCGL